MRRHARHQQARDAELLGELRRMQRAVAAAGHDGEIARVLGKKEFADLIGCAPSYVTKLRKEGRLVLTPNGRGVRAWGWMDSMV